LRIGSIFAIDSENPPPRLISHANYFAGISHCGLAAAMVWGNPINIGSTEADQDG